MKYSRRALAGASFFIGMVILIIGLNVAEQTYPNYSVSQNYISDLGATCRGIDCHIIQPSAIIFDSSIFLAGAFIILGAYIMRHELGSRVLFFLMAISGAGAICVGVFPEYTGDLHRLAAMVTFVFGGLSPIFAAIILRPPFRYLSILLGSISLASIALYLSHQYLGLGIGGMERMVVYPFVLWLLGFGGYLMQAENPKE